MVHKGKHTCQQRRRAPQGGRVSKGSKSNFKSFKGHAEIGTKRHNSYCASWKCKGMAYQLQKCTQIFILANMIFYKQFAWCPYHYLCFVQWCCFSIILIPAEARATATEMIISICKTITPLLFAEVISLYYPCIIYTIDVGSYLRWSTSGMAN